MGVANADPAGSHESELAARLAAIVESSDDAILGKRLDGTITSWNGAAARIYGYTPEEVIGRNISLIIPPGRQAELESILGQVACGERVAPFETKRRRKDGTIIDVSVCISPIRDRSGAVIGASTVARDVTERTRMEVIRRAMKKEQYRSERLEILGQLAGGIAHDFNNLLAAIMNYAGFVAQDTADRPAVHADAEQIQVAAQRAARLTRQLLIFSRREEIEPEPLDLNTIIDDLHHLLLTSIGTAIELELALDERPATILADRGQLEQVMLNLAINARDAMPGGGTLRIGTGQVVFGEGYAHTHPGVSPGRYVELVVADDGTGMEPEVAARVFEPFFTTKPRGEGTGLGLSTVYGIVAQADGGMTVESTPGLGTTFRCYLPAVDVPVAVPGASGRPAAGRGARDVPHYPATVLVVDDEPAMLTAASRILRQHGYTTLEAGTCADALSLASSRDFQLLLTDSVMPEMSGPTLAQQVTRLKPGLPVLHMSGNDATAVSEQQGAQDLSELAHIQKPFTADLLIEKVRSALGPR
jgi:PAS domain S-box-containing protein